MDVLAVDWSGAKAGAAAHIWTAHLRQGEFVELRNGWSRTQVVDHLVELRRQCSEGLTIGLDFAFSFPAWFLHARACADVGGLWRTVAAEGELWLTECLPPFWGRPGRARPVLPVHLRRCEQVAILGGIGAKSVFQIGGAGAVGTGSLRGMPHLLRLRQAGFSIWPFDPPSRWTAVEIYPRLLTGAVHKRNAEARASYLTAVPWTLPPSVARAMRRSEDAFDAAISALVMDRHADDLASLRQAADPITLLEGAVWRPPTLDS